MNITNKLYRVEQIREIEQRAIKKFQISEAEMMQKAGVSTLEVLSIIFPLVHI